MHCFFCTSCVCGVSHQGAWPDTLEVKMCHLLDGARQTHEVNGSDEAEGHWTGVDPHQVAAAEQDHQWWTLCVCIPGHCHFRWLLIHWEFFLSDMPLGSVWKKEKDAREIIIPQKKFWSNVVGQVKYLLIRGYLQMKKCAKEVQQPGKCCKYKWDKTVT